MADRKLFLQRVSANLQRSVPASQEALASASAPPPEELPPLIIPGLPGQHDREALLRLFAARLLELRATTSRTPTRDVALHEVADVLRDRGATIACPPSLKWQAIDGLWIDDPRAAAFGLSEAEWGIASSGTVVLLNRGECGRGYSLIPPAVGFLLPASRVVPQLGHVLAALQSSAMAPPPTCVTFVSGASHSADIAGVPCYGVHGPEEVHLWLIDDE